MKMHGATRFAKAKKCAAVVGLAACVLSQGGLPVSAATLKDVFDEHYYADTYKDLKEKYGYNREALWNHYIRYGLAEGRPMNRLFDVVKYREQYADLNAAFGADWDAYINHYLTVGAKEGRDNGTGNEFNAFDYAARYSDLQAAFGNDVLALWKHYQTVGAQENREARSEEVVEAEIEAEREAAEKDEAEATPKPQETEKPTPKPEENQKPQETPKPEGTPEPGTSEGRTERVERSNGAWALIQYDKDDKQVKTTEYNADGDVLYYSIPEYVDGKMVKAISYNPDNSVKGLNEYDEEEKLVKYTGYLKDGKTIDYTADFVTGIWIRYKYDDNGVLVRIRETRGGGLNPKVLKETYFDSMGRIEHICDYTADIWSDYSYGRTVLRLIREYEGAAEKGKLLKETQFVNDDSGDVLRYKIPEYDADGKKTGEKDYYPDGVTLEAVNVLGKNEEVLKRTTYYEDGRIKFIRDFESGALSQYNYNEDLSLKSITESKVSTSNDTVPWKEIFFKIGSETEIDYYVVYQYDEDGNLVGQKTYNADGTEKE